MLLKKAVWALSAAAALALAGCAKDGDKKVEAKAEAEKPVAVKTEVKPEVKPDVAKPQVSAHYGAPLTLTEKDTIPAGTIFAETAKYEQKLVRVSGKVGGVCDKKGCWMTLGDGGKSAQTIFIKFPDPPEGRLIPMEALGKDAVIEGTLAWMTLSEATARHFKEDAGAPEEEIKKIVGPQKTLTVKNAAVLIIGVPQTQVN